ncbi:MAG: helix-turn-helix domain-containing protein [Salibacteraceae bacterium]
MKEWQLNFQEAMLKNNHQLVGLTNKLMTVLTSDDIFKDMQVELSLRELVLCLLKIENLKGLRKNQSKSSKAAFQAVLQYIHTQISNPIRIEDLCRIACMSKSSFYRAFTVEFGITPVQLILEERIRHAKQLLEETDLSVKEVAFAAGFNDPNYFSRAFRKLEGRSPSCYRTPLP